MSTYILVHFVLAVNTYSPEVVNVSNGSESPRFIIGRVQKEVAHHLRVVEHRGARHSKRDWKTSNKRALPLARWARLSKIFQ